MVPDMKELITKSDVGNILKYARLKNKLSVDEVAAALKSYGYILRPRSLYNYETGLSMPPVNMFLVLCRIYGLDDIVAQYLPPEDSAPDPNLDDDERRLINLYRASSPETRRLLFKLLS